MKNLLTGAISMLFFCTGINVSAQNKLPVREADNNKPALFKNLPSRINCRISNMESLLEFPVGKKVSVQLTDEILFQGILSSVSSRENNGLKSVVIKSSNIQGAALTFSKITNDDGSHYFSGRMMSFQHDDVYEITNEKGQYAFVKKKFNDLVNE